MPFQDNNTRPGRAFSANANGGSRPARPRTYTVEITGYDLPHSALIGKTRLASGEEQVLEIHINENTVARQRTRDQAKANNNQANSDAGRFSGSYIDEKMSSALPVGSLIKVEHGVRQRSVKVGGETRQVIEANWIHAVPDNNPDKAVDCPVTAGSYHGRITNLQLYTGRRSLSTQSEAGETAIRQLIADMDAAVEGYDPKAYRPRLGARFVAVRETDRTKEIYNTAEGKKVATPVCEVIDRSFRYDWTVVDEENGRPMSGKDLEDSLVGYLEYVEATYGTDKVHVEVRPYEVRSVSKTDTSFDSANGKNWRVQDLIGTPGKLAQGEGEQFYTGYYGCDASILIMGDKADKGKLVTNSMVTRLFLEGYSADIDELIKTENGAVVEVIPELVAKPEARKKNENTAQGGAPEGERFTSGLAANVEDNPFGTDGGDAFGSTEGGDPYGAAFDTAPAPAAEAPAPAPAPEPSRSRLRRG